MSLLTLLGCQNDLGYKFDEPKPLSSDTAETQDTSIPTSTDTSESDPQTCPSQIVLPTTDGKNEVCLQFEKQEFVTGEEIASSTAFDFDNDGDLDLYLGIINGNADILLENSDAEFVDKSLELGIFHGGSTFDVLNRDFNNDGFVDLLIAAANSIQIIKNNGGSGFSLESEIEINAPTSLQTFGQLIFVGSSNGLKLIQINADLSLSEISADQLGLSDYGQAADLVLLDGDDDLYVDDLYVANSVGLDRLFVQNGGQFNSIVGESLFNADSQSSMGALVFNFNNTYPNSLYVLKSDGQNKLYLNLGLGVFEEQSEAWLLNVSGSSCGAAYFSLFPNIVESLFIARCTSSETMLIENLNESQTGYTNMAEPLKMDLSGLSKNIYNFDVNQDGLADVIVPLYNGSIAIYINESFEFVQ